MKISSVNVTQTGDPSLSILGLVSDEQLTGLSLIPTPIGALAESLAKQNLLGEDPRAVNSLWDRLVKVTQGRDNAAQAIACLDLACWDLKARILEEPLWKVLGGARPNIVAYASPQRSIQSNSELADYCASLASHQGISGVCLVLSDDAKADAEKLNRAKKLMKKPGQPVDLMLDVGQLEPSDVIRRIRSLESVFDISWVRAAAAKENFLGSKRVSDTIRAGVCAGRYLQNESVFLPWLHHEAVDVVEINIQQLGVTGALRVAEAAYGFELPVTLSAFPGNIHVHLASVMPNSMSVELSNVEFQNTGFTTDITFVGGRGTAGDRPGTGLEVQGEVS